MQSQEQSKAIYEVGTLYNGEETRHNTLDEALEVARAFVDEEMYDDDDKVCIWEDGVVILSGRPGSI